MQLNFLKKFFRCFLNKEINNKLSELINKLYTDCFLKRDIKKIKLLYEKNKLHNFNQFLIKHPNIFKKFLYMSSSVKLNYSLMKILTLMKVFI